MLKTVSFPTWSALGKSSRNSANDRIVAGLSNRYQCLKPDLVFGYLLANSLSRLRVMMCIDEFYAKPAAEFCGETMPRAKVF
jgi:hypothetical protein